MTLRIARAAAVLLLLACSASAQTQGDLDAGAAADLQKADAELNQVYQQVLKEYADDPLVVTKLRAAQRAWIALRDAELDASYPHAKEPGYYGSVFPMCLAGRQAELTRQRTADLRRWLKGVPEGEVCGGALKIK
jgi:uncharacterized protein YecT (DUF1311 family)